MIRNNIGMGVHPPAAYSQQGANRPTPIVFGKVPDSSNANTPNPSSDNENRVILRLKPLHQGNTNGCGTTSLAMVLNYLAAIRDGKDPATYQPFTREALDAGIRKLDSFVSPVLLQESARAQGFFAEIYNDTTFEEVRDQLSKGNLMLAVHNPYVSNDDSLHYVVIHGVEDSKNPQEQKLLVTCPAEPKGRQTYWTSFDDFSRKHWQNVTWRKINTGMNRMMLAVSSQNNLPPSRNVSLPVQVATAVNRAINWLGQLF